MFASLIGSISSAIMGAEQEKEAERLRAESNAMFNQAIEMQSQFLNRLEGVYGNTIENYGKYVENLSGEAFSAPYVQELRLQAQQMKDQQAKAIQSAGLSGSGYGVQSQKQIDQQVAEQTAQAVMAGQQQARQIQGQFASQGIGMIGNQSNTIANTRLSRSNALLGEASAMQEKADANIMQGIQLGADFLQSATTALVGGGAGGGLSKLAGGLSGGGGGGASIPPFGQLGLNGKNLFNR